MPENRAAKIAEPFVCGGTAATMASIAIHPMDLAKVSDFGKNLLPSTVAAQHQL